MKFITLFTGEDNQSHFKQIDSEFERKNPLGNYSKKYPVKAMMFRDFEKDATFDWHNAPQPQYIFYLEGEVEVEASDGEKRIFKSGDVLFVADLTGKGHITRTLSKGRSVIVTTEDEKENQAAFCNSVPQSNDEQYYDLTAKVSEKTVVFPGDPEYKSEDVCSLANGSEFHLCHMHLGNHTGTHIDFPAHVIQGAKTSSDYPIESLIGMGVIIELPKTETSINKNFIQQQDIMRGDFVFFKTSNSKISKNAEFTSNYVYIETEAAEELLLRGVKIVGIDYISVDKYESEGFPVHKALLTNDVLIVEGLELGGIAMGRWMIYILPINIENMDGLPARVIARK